MDNEDVGEMLQGIEKIAQCPICLEIVRPPVKQCENGHMSCGDCCKDLPECSVCRGPFIESINRVLEQLLDFLPKPCPHVAAGCKNVSLQDNHTKYCEFRPITCKVGMDNACNWSGSIKEWKNHAKTEHNEPYIIESYKTPFTLSIENFNGEWSSCCYYLQVEEESFLFLVQKNGNTVRHILKHVQCKKPGKEYYYKIRYVNEEHLFYKTLIQATPLEENDNIDKDPAVFLLEDLNQVINGEGSLKIVVEALQVDYPEIG